MRSGGIGAPAAPGGTTSRRPVPSLRKSARAKRPPADHPQAQGPRMIPRASDAVCLPAFRTAGISALPCLRLPAEGSAASVAATLLATGGPVHEGVLRFLAGRRGHMDDRPRSQRASQGRDAWSRRSRQRTGERSEEESPRGRRSTRASRAGALLSSWWRQRGCDGAHTWASSPLPLGGGARYCSGTAVRSRRRTPARTALSPRR